MNTQHIDDLTQSLAYLKNLFVGKDDIIDLMGICLVGRENLFLLGPPGTAKSAMVRELANLLEGKSFEYLLTRFTEPNELFGPFDIRKLREGELLTNTEGMLPEANLIFLDELLNANSAILNSLLMVLNERLFRRGKESRKIPSLMMVGASNHLPEEETLKALFDRFLIRVRCDNVAPEEIARVLDAGWKLEATERTAPPTIRVEQVRQLQEAIYEVELQPIRSAYIELVQQLRNAGLALSDRRAVKLQRLIAASALLCKRTQAQLSDFWVLRYVWDTEEQREIIAAIVNQWIDKETEEKAVHPRAQQKSLPDADAILAEVKTLEEKWQYQDLSMADRAMIKDRLRHLNGQCEWIANPEQKAYVLKPIESLWKEVLQYQA